MRHEPRVIAPRVAPKNTFVDVLAKQQQRQREPSWDSSDSEKENSSNPESSESTKIFFFSEAHAERALDGINDGEMDGVDAMVPDEGVMLEPEQHHQPLEIDSPVALHEADRCIPCVALLVTQTCPQGDDCPFCHFSHTGAASREERRPTKEMRVKCKNSIARIQSNARGDMQLMQDELQKLLANQSHFARKYTAKLLRDSKWAEAACGSKDGKHARGTEPSVSSAVSFGASSVKGSKGGPREIPALFATQSQSMVSDRQRDVLAGLHPITANALNARDNPRGYEVPPSLGPRKGKSKGSKGSWKGLIATMSL